MVKDEDRGKECAAPVSMSDAWGKREQSPQRLESERTDGLQTVPDSLDQTLL